MSPSFRIIRKPQVNRDILQAASFLAEDSLDAAECFLEATEVTFQALARMPRMGALRRYRNPAFAEVRMWPVKDFERFLVFYRPLGDGIEVLRVIHGARDIPRVLGAE